MYMNRSYAKSRFNDQKQSAAKRKIPFLFTFEEWDQWWLSRDIDRNIPQGKDAGCWCMCRYNDQGAYEPNNVYADSNSNNVKLRNKLYWRQRGILHTPFGEFQSIIDACQSLSMSRRQISYRMKTKPTEYYFVKS
jgi:hypothetical protein